MPKTILLIDDDPDFRSALRIPLEQAGYRIMEVSSAAAGIRSVAASRPDLIILDVMMEDISSGFRFAREINDRHETGQNRRIPILMISAVQTLTELDFKTLVGSERLPVDAFLDKPVSPESLLNEVRGLLQKTEQKNHTHESATG